MDATMLDMAFLRKALNPEVNSQKAIKEVLESLEIKGYGEIMKALGFTVYIGGNEIYLGDKESLEEPI